LKPTGYIQFSDRTYSGPVEIVTAYSHDDVLPAMQRVDLLVEAGRHAAGFVAYEAAPGFAPELAAHDPGKLPLVWFGIYENGDCARRSGKRAETGPSPFSHAPFSPGISEDDYHRSVQRIRELIAAGDTYQTNYTFPMTAGFNGDAADWFNELSHAQPTPYGAFIDTGRFKILSVSPELFFELDGERIVTRPMKGTRPRGLWLEQDKQLARELLDSEKERAENLMIVDLLRNDLGRIAKTGTVETETLFDVERYGTVWQMTSTISAQTAAPISSIFTALFPCGSVTGAPKIRTMQIIRELEPFPRGVYCGAIGWIAPGRKARFNVAIRTAVIDDKKQDASYHIGSGVIWDSTPENEYKECLLKAAVLTRRPQEFQLLESMLYDGGYFLLEEHMDRLRDSAEYFGFHLDESMVRKGLSDAVSDCKGGPRKVRLLVSRDGIFRIEIENRDCPNQSGKQTETRPTIRAAFATRPVDEKDPFLYHKTTNRAVYIDAKAFRPDCDDVILWNSRGEITEFTTANIVIEKSGRKLTPLINCGLLAGTMRRHLLESGEIEEAIITKEDITTADSIYLINSVRKWMKAELAD